MAGFNNFRSIPRLDLTPTACTYPSENLPPDMRNFAEAISKHYGIPLDICCTIAIAVCVMAVQDLADVMLPDGRLRPIVLFFLTIGDFSADNDVLFHALMSPFEAREKALEAAFLIAERDHPTYLRVAKKQLSDVLSMIAKCRSKGAACDHLLAELDQLVKNQPEKPRRQNFLVANTTGPAFLERLAGTNQSVALVQRNGIMPLVFQAEYAGLIDLAWAGSPVSVQRKGNGSMLSVGARVSALFMSSPEEIAELHRRLGDSVAVEAAWALFLSVNPPMPKRVVNPANVSAMSGECIRSLIGIIAACVAESGDRAKSGNTDRDVVVLDADARAKSDEFATALDREMNDDHSLCDVKAFASQAAEYAIRLAAAFTRFGGSTTITGDTMESAIVVICHHLSVHKARFSMAHAVPQVIMDADDLEKYLHDRFWIKGQADVPLSHIERHACTEELRKRDRLMPAIGLLESQGKIRIVKRDRTSYVQYRPGLHDK
jgi:hypothetical protein